MRRSVLTISVGSAQALACTAAAVVPVPNRLPAIALGAEPVWRVEIAAILFAAAYAAIVIVRLALHGETLTRVGRDGIEVPRVGRVGARDASDGIATSVADMQSSVLRLAEQLDALSDAIHLVLPSDDEET